MSVDAIACTDVWKVYRVGRRIVKALRGVDLRIAAECIVVLRGASGSGKSTLLNLIGGLDAPTKGVVTVLGTSVAEMGRAERGAFRRHNVGFVFQELVLVPHLSALENVALALAFDHPRATALARSAYLLGELGLDERLNHRPGELSYGERQRVAVARATARAPRILLADEPTANLDDTNAERVLAALQALRRTGAAVVVATHDPRVESIADRVITIQAGSLGQLP